MPRRSSHGRDERETKRELLASYPYVVYASWTPQGGELRWLVLKFMNAWNARNMIESLKHNLFGGKYELKRRPSLSWHYMKFENGMEVSLRDDEQYKEVMELEFDESEAYVSDQVRYFKYGSSPTAYRGNGDTRPDDGPEHAPRRSKRDTDTGPREPRVPRVKADKSGKISANDIALELGVTGRDVRGVLRSLKLVKGPGGWLFDEKAAEEIRDKIKSGLKKK